MHRFQRISQPVRRTCSPSRDVKGFGRTPIRYPGSNAERFEHESLGTGPVSVAGYKRDGRPEEVAMMEKAQTYGAHSVFFEAGGAGAPPWQERSHPQELLAHSPQLRRRWQVMRPAPRLNPRCRVRTRSSRCSSDSCAAVRRRMLQLQLPPRLPGIGSQ
jgi:hypothetical protein